MKVGDLVKSAPGFSWGTRNRIGLVIELKPLNGDDNKALVWWAADWQEWYAVRNLVEVLNESR
ncbi:MAG: hypothetical protein CMB80_03270 [Flammeovirgaceae bacterium]|nr:hypothetical protein [Flammeovirgaceae bacterium]